MQVAVAQVTVPVFVPPVADVIAAPPSKVARSARVAGLMEPPESVPTKSLLTCARSTRPPAAVQVPALVQTNCAVKPKHCAKVDGEEELEEQVPAAAA